MVVELYRRKSSFSERWGELWELARQLSNFYNIIGRCVMFSTGSVGEIKKLLCDISVCSIQGYSGV